MTGMRIELRVTTSVGAASAEYVVAMDFDSSMLSSTGTKCAIDAMRAMLSAASPVVEAAATEGGQG